MAPFEIGAVLGAGAALGVGGAVTSGATADALIAGETGWLSVGGDSWARARTGIIHATAAHTMTVFLCAMSNTVELKAHFNRDRTLSDVGGNVGLGYGCTTL